MPCATLGVVTPSLQASSRGSSNNDRRFGSDRPSVETVPSAAVSRTIEVAGPYPLLGAGDRPPAHSCRNGKPGMVPRRSVRVATLAVALFAMSACSDAAGPRAQPDDLLLSPTDHECADLTKGGDTETSWCATGITSFDAELTYENLKDHYGLLVVVNGRLLPSADYEIWDEEGKFVLVASSHGSTSLRELTYVIQSEGQTVRCGGATQILQCTPEAP